MVSGNTAILHGQNLQLVISALWGPSVASSALRRSAVMFEVIVQLFNSYDADDIVTQSLLNDVHFELNKYEYEQDTLMFQMS